MGKDALELFNARSDQIRERYGELLAMEGLLPLETLTGQTYDAGQLKTWEKELEDHSFVIAVCGQIKAGKSTTLNALFFREDFIPEAATPLTAAITIIRHEPDKEWERFEVTFFSEEEWTAREAAAKETERRIQALRKSGAGEDADKAFELEKDLADQRADVEAMMAKGVDWKRLLGTTKVVKGLSRAELEQYVAPVAEEDGKGLYTPLVKHVTVHTANEKLRGVTVVDTPGTNDTNTSRSQVTLDWLKAANAVIFLTYAGRAFDRKDLQFIDDYLLNVPADCLFVVVNKVDVLNDADSLEGLRDYFRENILENEDVISRKGFISTETPHAFISAQAERLWQKMDADEPLTRKDENTLKRLEKVDEDFCDALHGRFEKFSAALSGRLIEASGEKLLASHAQRILGIIEAAERKLEAGVRAAGDSLANLDKDAGQLREEKERLDETLKKMGDISRESEERMKAERAEALTSLDGIFARGAEELRRDLEETIDSCQDREAFKKSLAWALKERVTNQRKAMRPPLGKTLRKLSEEYRSIINTLETRLKEHDRFFAGIRGVRTEVDARLGEMFAGFSRSAESFDESRLAALYENQKETFLFWETNREQTLAECKRIVADHFVDPVLEALEEAWALLRGQIEKQSSDLFTAMTNAYRRAVQGKWEGVEASIKKVQAGQQAIETDRKALEREKETLSRRLEELRAKKAELEAWKKDLCLAEAQ